MTKWSHLVSVVATTLCGSAACTVEFDDREPCDAPAVVQWVGPAASARDNKVLGTGFEVPSVTLRSNGDGTFSLPISEDATHTVCAAFRCPPEIERGRARGSDPELFVASSDIVNFAECVVAYDTFVGREPLIKAELLQQLPLAATCDGLTATAEAIAIARTSARWLGCWVYGSTGIIEASDLHAVEGASEGAVLAPDCAAMEDPLRRPAQGWAGCIVPGNEGVGVCVEGICQSWCAEQSCPTQ